MAENTILKPRRPKFEKDATVEIVTVTVTIPPRDKKYKPFFGTLNSDTIFTIFFEDIL